MWTAVDQNPALASQQQEHVPITYQDEHGVLTVSVDGERDPQVVAELQQHGLDGF